MRRGCWWALPLSCLGAAALAGQAQPSWSLAQQARNGFADLWDASMAGRREFVACLGGRLDGDTVFVTGILQLEVAQSDSLTAGAGESIERCGPPEWIGTVHTHVRSTDDDSPSAQFSPSDRVVMSAWVNRWSQQGAFCLLHSDRAAKCEVYPPGLPLRPRRE